MKINANVNSLFWHAQKPENASQVDSNNCHIQEEELLEQDDEYEAASAASTKPTTSAERA